MSFPSSHDYRYRRGGAGVPSSSRRTVLGYWVPLALTVGIATASIAAWIWSERIDDDEDNGGGGGGGSGGYDGDTYLKETDPSIAADIAADSAQATAPGLAESRQEDGSMIARMHGALRRTPSPQQIFDGASRRVAAGVAAAGALVGGALTSIREEGRGDFEDHSRWSEEMRSRTAGQVASTTEAVGSGGLAATPSGFATRKKTVAIIVSSELSRSDDDAFVREQAVS